MTTRARRAPVLGVMAAIVLLALNLRTLVAGPAAAAGRHPRRPRALRAGGRAADDAAGARLRRVRAAGAAAVAAGADRAAAGGVRAAHGGRRGAAGRRRRGAAVPRLRAGGGRGGGGAGAAAGLHPHAPRRGDGAADRRVLDVADARARRWRRRWPCRWRSGSARGRRRWRRGRCRRWWPRRCGRRSRGGRGSVVQGESPPGLWGNRLAWTVSLFMGVQSMAFYAGLTWIPTILEDHGYSAGTAGALQALSALVQLAPAFAVPVLAARRRDQVGLLWWIVLLAARGRARAAAGDRRRAAVDRRARHRAGRRARARPDPAGAARRRARPRWPR